MDQEDIVNRLGAHNKQKTTLSCGRNTWITNYPKIVRENAIEFFANDKLTTNHKILENHIFEFKIFFAGV